MGDNGDKGSDPLAATESTRQPVIGVTSSLHGDVAHYVKRVEAAGGNPRVLRPTSEATLGKALASIDGLLMTGGADIHPSFYGEQPNPSANLKLDTNGRDEFEVALAKQALEKDLPVLGICRGLQLLNVVSGGKLIQNVSGHTSGSFAPLYHQVFVPPGCRLTLILGVAGFMKVNSYHHQAIKLPQKASGLTVSAYSLDDGIIEALESPGHRWVVGIQWHPERIDEIYPYFQNLFKGLIQAAQQTHSVAEST